VGALLAFAFYFVIPYQAVEPRARLSIVARADKA
jgi:hypothetical protein